MRAAQEARAIDDVGNAPLDRRDQAAVVVWIVLKVCVLDDNDVSVRLHKTAAERRALAEVALLAKYSDVVRANGFLKVREQDTLSSAPGALTNLLKELASPVSGPVVHDDNFHLQVLRLNSPEEFLNGGSFVEDGNDDRDLHFRCGRLPDDECNSTQDKPYTGPLSQRDRFTQVSRSE